MMTGRMGEHVAHRHSVLLIDYKGVMMCEVGHQIQWSSSNKKKEEK